ncbi:MAG: adenylate/guanylate cyclase domain-containing protein [Azospirillaceae bacterium]
MPSVDLTRFNEMLLDTARVGLALIDAESLRVVYGNRRFDEMFPQADAGARTLPDLLPALDIERTRERMAAGRPIATELEIKAKRRAVTIGITLSPADPDSGRPLLVLEAQNVSKIKELEYMIESYSKMVERQNRTLQREMERAEKLLLNIMPKAIYEELKAFGVTTPQRFDEVSVLMLDFVGFTEMAISRDPSALIAELNDIFTSFDRIAEQFGCERIKTIGDAYMAVAGVPDPQTDHAQAVAKCALLFRRYLERRNKTYEQAWRCRIGLATGPVIGSIVGVQKYVYDIFGPGVNLAARMEALAEPMEIVLPDSLRGRIADDFRCVARGTVTVKGFGEQEVFSLVAGTDVPGAHGVGAVPGWDVDPF